MEADEGHGDAGFKVQQNLRRGCSQYWEVSMGSTEVYGVVYIRGLQCVVPGGGGGCCTGPDVRSPRLAAKVTSYIARSNVLYRAIYWRMDETLLITPKNTILLGEGTARRMTKRSHTYLSHLVPG